MGHRDTEIEKAAAAYRQAVDAADAAVPGPHSLITSASGTSSGRSSVSDCTQDHRPELSVGEVVDPAGRQELWPPSPGPTGGAALAPAA